jgi:hypothetical protein
MPPIDESLILAETWRNATPGGKNFALDGSQSGKLAAKDAEDTELEDNQRAVHFAPHRSRATVFRALRFLVANHALVACNEASVAASPSPRGKGAELGHATSPYWIHGLPGVRFYAGMAVVLPSLRSLYQSGNTIAAPTSCRALSALAASVRKMVDERKKKGFYLRRRHQIKPAIAPDTSKVMLPGSGTPTRRKPTRLLSSVG